MFLSNASVRRPVAMACLIIALTFLGVNAYRKIGLELFPKVDLPYITITTVYPGASPAEIETDVARPIEDAVFTIEGLKHVTSSAMENVCLTFLEFNLDVDVDIAATDVREKLDLIRADFPSDAQDPKILKYDINAKPVAQLALTGDAPLAELYDYADNTLRNLISVLPGVADVQLIGGAEREVHVLLDREALAARGLTSSEVVQAIQYGVRTIPIGRVRENGSEYTVRFDADFDRVGDIGRLELVNRDGRRCYLRDVGRVVMATEELRQLASVDGRPAVAVKVIKKSDANAVAVVDGVRAAMSGLRSRLPGGMELVWIADDGMFTRASMNSAWINVAEGILLTAVILFFFLYNVRAMLVVCVTMPLTIVTGLFFIQFIGLTFNTLTLMAIGMSVGVLVTNSIVVLEAIVTRLTQSGDPKTASRLGSAEAAVAVIASAGTNIVVLFPMATMHSQVGIFVSSFALTLVIMTAVSLFISFTLTPLLCSVLLKPARRDQRTVLGRMENGWNLVFDRVIFGYGRVLHFFEARRWAAVLFLVGVVAAFLLTMSLAGRLGSSMTSEPDRAEIFVKMEFPTRYSLARTRDRVREVEEKLKGLPHLKHILSTMGKVEGMTGQSSEGVYLAQVLLRFSEKTERKVSIHELMAGVRSRLHGFPDCIMSIAIPNFSGGQASDVEMEISGADLGTLDRLAQTAQGLSAKIPGILDPDTTVRQGKPELRVRPDRAVLSDLGSPVTGVGLALRANLEGTEAGTFKKDSRNYDIVVKLEEREGKGQIAAFLFPGKPGNPIPLTNLGTVQESLAPIQIVRKDKQRISKLFANLEGVPLGTAVSVIGEALDEKGRFPAGYEYTFRGMYESLAEAQAELGEAALVAVVLVFLTLAAILESFKQPIIILVTLPLALIGMIWALFLAGSNLEFFVLMGGVMLIGIVVNNAILIMDQFNSNLKQGARRHRAMIDASRGKLRPIIMITLAAVLGMLPMALGAGLGAELRNASGIGSAGGILVSGILSVFVLPILYNLLTRRSQRIGTPDTPDGA